MITIDEGSLPAELLVNKRKLIGILLDRRRVKRPAVGGIPSKVRFGVSGKLAQTPPDDAERT